MKIVEEGSAFKVRFCHFRTIIHKNQYNLSFTKLDLKNTYEISLVPIAISNREDKIFYDKDLRPFICDKIYKFMKDNKSIIYFNINSIGLENEFLLWKFIRWIKSYPEKLNVDTKVVEDEKNSIRFFEFYLSID